MQMRLHRAHKNIINQDQLVQLEVQGVDQVEAGIQDQNHQLIGKAMHLIEADHRARKTKRQSRDLDPIVGLVRPQDKAVQGLGLALDLEVVKVYRIKKGIQDPEAHQEIEAEVKAGNQGHQKLIVKEVGVMFLGKVGVILLVQINQEVNRQGLVDQKVQVQIIVEVVRKVDLDLLLKRGQEVVLLIHKMKNLIMKEELSEVQRKGNEQC